MVELVIKIPEEEYNIIKKSNKPMSWVEHLIANGTSLPKGHGDLKDMNDIYEALEGWDDDTGWIVDAIDCQTQTIIEADKESE